MRPTAEFLKMFRLLKSAYIDEVLVTSSRPGDDPIVLSHNIDAFDEWLEKRHGAAEVNKYEVCVQVVRSKKDVGEQSGSRSSAPAVSPMGAEMLAHRLAQSADLTPPKNVAIDDRLVPVQGAFVSIQSSPEPTQDIGMITREDGMVHLLLPAGWYTFAANAKPSLKGAGQLLVGGAPGLKSFVMIHID